MTLMKLWLRSRQGWGEDTVRTQSQIWRCHPPQNNISTWNSWWNL